MRVTGETIELAAAGVVEPEDDGARLARLFDAHHQRLYRLARRLTPTADEAKDLVQETFLRLARSPASVPDGQGSEEAWLVRVLVNLCRDGWRRRSVRYRADALHHPSQVRASASHEAAFIARSTVWAALHELPPRRRAVIVLYELEGTTMPEIARVLGVSAVTVRWHLSRGRRELARIISEKERV